MIYITYFIFNTLNILFAPDYSSKKQPTQLLCLATEAVFLFIALRVNAVMTTKK